MKIVFDTNVILSALLSQGLSFRVLDICVDAHRLFISDFILSEVSEKLRVKFGVPKKEEDKAMKLLKEMFHKVNPKGEPPDLCKDKDDNAILHLAQFIQARYLITGDKELLKMKRTQKTQIISPREFMDLYCQALT
jgi:putative PIN family toxin of toxin-antitoxin system